MIGRPEWFTRRKYSGWGLTPKSWQGWLYIACFIVPFIIFQSLPFWSNTTRTIITLVWMGILVVDVIDMMIRLKKDEREKAIEAIAERNAAWVMVTVISLGIVYEVSIAALQERLYIPPFLTAALVLGLFAKMATNLYLERTQ